MVVSVRDVATEAGVSVGTVSNVLNRPEKVSAQNSARVHAAIAKLGFVRNDAARQLRAGRSRSLGMAVLDIRNPFFADVVRGAEERADVHGFSILVANSDANPRREATHLGLFEEQRVAGVLITPVQEVSAQLDGLRTRGIPAVLVDRESRDPELASVAVDDVMGGRIAVEHLVSIGRRRIAFVGGPMNIRQIADRLSGAQQIATSRGTSVEIIAADAPSVEEGRRVGQRIVERADDARPDGIFAANDMLALGILQSLVMTGHMKVPGDIALVGYDDIGFAASAVIPLSSVRQPAALIGATAVDLLVGADPQLQKHVRFEPELVPRATTART